MKDGLVEPPRALNCEPGEHWSETFLIPCRVGRDRHRRRPPEARPRVPAKAPLAPEAKGSSRNTITRAFCSTQPAHGRGQRRVRQGGEEHHQRAGRRPGSAHSVTAERERRRSPAPRRSASSMASSWRPPSASTHSTVLRGGKSQARISVVLQRPVQQGGGRFHRDLQTGLHSLADLASRRGCRARGASFPRCRARTR